VLLTDPRWLRTAPRVEPPITGEELRGFERANEQRRRLNGTSAAPVMVPDEEDDFA